MDQKWTPVDTYVPLKTIAVCLNEGYKGRYSYIVALDESGMPWHLDLSEDEPKWERLPVAR